MSKVFLNLIEKLSPLLDITLEATEEKMITLLCAKSLPVQIEIDSTDTRLQVLSQIAEIPPGKFKENVFLYSLMANTYPNIKEGALAFSQNLGKLIYFHTLPMHTVTAENFHPFLLQFIANAREWQKAIENLNPAPPSVLNLSRKTSEIKPFGIKP